MWGHMSLWNVQGPLVFWGHPCPVYSAIVCLGTIRPDDSGAVFFIAKPQVSRLDMSGGINPLDMPRTPYRASKGKFSHDPPCPITLTPSFTSLLYIFHLIN